ncbi:MAG: TIGR01458 family HAD-type hydrolase [Gammaproteobacteria bacterium]
MIRALLLDLSGVLYVGRQALPGARDAVTRLQTAGMPVRYVTNTTRTPRNTILRQLSDLGFAIRPDELLTAPDAARRYLADHSLSAFALIHPALRPEFADLIHAGADAVLIGDAGHEFTYENLNRAFRLLADGAPLIAMGRNRYFRETDGLSLDAGPFITALEYAADTEAIVTGKPAAAFFGAAAADLGCEADEILMVGDDVEADVLGALDAGLQAALVRTGKFRPGDEQRLQGTTAQTFDDLNAVVEWVLEGGME